MRPSHTPPGIEPDLPNTPGYIARQRHPPIQRGYAADFGAGKEGSHRATPIGFLAEQVEAQEDKSEQVEDRQRWLARADALALAAAVREALDAQDADNDESAILQTFTASEIETIFALGLEQWQQTIQQISQTNKEIDP